ncbi:MAG TPA: FAD-dependent oxidoreductase, partial [Lysobacter sp.]
MEQREDVVVVGAGVIGLCTALALLEGGRGVRVVDAGRIGGGSSHGNCGTITPSHAPPLAAPGMVGTALRMMLSPESPLYIRPKLDPVLWRWLWRFGARCNARDWEASARAKATLLNDSRRRLHEWVDRYGLDCEFVESGEDYVFRDARRFAHGQLELGLLRELGIGVELFDGAAYEREEPAMKPGVAGAIRFCGDAALRPDRYLAELARAVRERGGTIDEHRAVDGIEAEPRGVRL